MAIYYINGTTLSNSTAVFTDAALTTCAPDGFYSDGSGISRNQVSCVLGPIQSCPECLEECNTGPLSATTGQGTFLLDVDLGDTVSDVGAVIIKFVPASVPDGIRATYNGVVYNTLSSDVDGEHSGTAGGYTYVGDNGAICLPIAGTTYSNLPIYRYNGTSFANTGATQSITPQAGELSFSIGVVPGNLYMVIPKTALTPKSLNIEMSGVCTGTAFGVEVSCPTLLTGYASSSTPLSNSVDACTATVGSTYYNAPVAGTPGVPEIFDFVFYDAYGVSALVNGFYKITGSKWIEVVSGIVIDKGNC